MGRKWMEKTAYLCTLAARRFKQSHLIYEGILADIQLLRQRHENATGVRGHFN